MAERGDGRRVRATRKVRLGDVTSRSRLRLDGVARYLQDVAGDDGEDAHLPALHGWILRRLAVTVERLPVLGEPVALTTWCTGVGSRWAERTTTLGVDEGPPAVTARAVWVWVDLETGAPRPLPDEFFAVYGDGCRDHRVSARLTLPAVPADGVGRPWPLRRTDVDVFDHVNNANYWAAVEEWLAGPGADRRIAAAEIEFGAGIAPDDRCEVVVADTDTAATWWFVVDGDTRATARVRFARP